MLSRHFGLVVLFALVASFGCSQPTATTPADGELATYLQENPDVAARTGEPEGVEIGTELPE